jgi:hypothetical protein
MALGLGKLTWQTRTAGTRAYVDLQLRPSYQALTSIAWFKVNISNLQMDLNLPQVLVPTLVRI